MRCSLISSGFRSCGAEAPCRLEGCPTTGRNSVIRVIALALVISSAGYAQMSEAAIWAATLSRNYRVLSDVTYYTVQNWNAKLDVYQPKFASKPTPVLMFFHGGGWSGMTRMDMSLYILPYLEM